jgi:ribosomal protein S18 acetylase RimI-like enzyme
MVLIERLDHRDPSVASLIHRSLMLGHAQEAAMLQVEHLAPLDRKPEDIQASDACYLGAFKRGALVGSVSFAPDDEPDQYLVRSLAVHPDHQRQGIARSLMARVLDLAGNCSTAVATAARNMPALALYRDLGFVEYRRGTLGAQALPLVKLRRGAPAS